MEMEMDMDMDEFVCLRQKIRRASGCELRLRFCNVDLHVRVLCVWEESGVQVVVGWRRAGGRDNETGTACRYDVVYSV